MEAEHIALPLHEKGRQPYHVGWIHPKKSLAELKRHLKQEWGFGNHFVAWEDPGQILSWRKLADFDDQYHLRVFEDGEIRCHFEYTPESAPLRHFFATRFYPRRNDFLQYLDGYVVFQKYPRVIAVEKHRPSPRSEIVFQET